MALMSTPSSSVARPGPVLHGFYPLVWEPCAAEISAREAQVVDESNEMTLRNYLLLDHRAQESSEDRDETLPDIQRLEQRLNLVIDLLAQVLSRDLQLPLPVQCELSRDAVEWAGESLPAVGAFVKLSLFLNPNYPRPLIVYGRVEHLDNQADRRAARVVLSGLPETVGEWLDRLIFRDHRRRIAQTKRGNKPVSGS